jgi:hypothetical protein
MNQTATTLSISHLHRESRGLWIGDKKRETQESAILGSAKPESTFDFGRCF